MKSANTCRKTCKKSRMPKKQNNKNVNIPYILSHRDLDTIKPNSCILSSFLPIIIPEKM